MSSGGNKKNGGNLSGVLAKAQRKTGAQVEIHSVPGTGSLRGMRGDETGDRPGTVRPAVVSAEDDI